MVTFANDTLSKLCSKDQLALLDSIDRLRSQGINNYISLPQIIVCGDQSSGKSSVLEAISGVSFPIKSNLCTRFPTELVLRRTPNLSARVSIIPHESRPTAKQDALRAFHEVLVGFDDLPNLIELAKSAMGITPHGKAFTNDILRVEITGPDRPHLTIVDLPGLIHSNTKNQTSSEVELIKDVVQSYMEKARCIILAVVSAKNDFANQVVLKLAQAADTNGNRTLGVITKPDMLTPGSQSEALYVSLARNQEVEFCHGWHVLKNADSEKGVWTVAERDAAEAKLFSSGVWTELALSCLGINKLRGRLSKLLLGQIASELPGLMKEIEDKFNTCQGQLEKLGDARANPDEQRLYLIHLSQSFQGLVKASVAGTYSNPFFGDANTETGYQKRIRAVIRNLNEDFASEMSLRGHYREIKETAKEPTAVESHGGMITTSREDFISHIEHLLRQTRGCELPGTFNPMIVADLFLEQSRPWEAIARRHVERVWDTACRFIELVVAHTADASTAKALYHKVLEPAMKEILEEMRSKTTELLNPHQNGHPITYNHYFTETLQKVRRERSRRQPDRILREFFHVDSLGPGVLLNSRFNLQKLADPLAESGNEPDMKRFAASEALDCLNAYYKVALKRFIDDVAVEVIEAKLVWALDNMFPPISIHQMPDDQVARIAGESEETRAEREQLVKQLGVLRSGLNTCKQFISFRMIGDSAFVSANGTSISSPSGSDSAAIDELHAQPSTAASQAKLPARVPAGVDAEPLARTRDG